MMKVPRFEKSSSPSSLASASPFSGLPFVTASTFVPISGTSPAMKPCTTDSDRTSASSASMRISLSTKERIGSRDVG
ncbi:hypothetical protein D9M69_668160 [compost metagenome]